MDVEAGNMHSREKELFIRIQINLAETLAGNEARVRAKAIRKIRRYLLARSNGVSRFTQDDFLRLWKSFFYCMWMCDRPLIQEELAERMSELTHCFQQGETALAFIKAHFNTVLIEWYGIDYSQIDKFQMLVRRFLSQCFEYCKKKNWSESIVSGLCEVFEHTILSPSKLCEEHVDLSLVIYFVRVFVEELGKIGDKKLPRRVALEFLKPFCDCMVEFDEPNLLYAIRDHIFYCLIRQCPLGLEYEEKFAAWKAAGFPGKSWKQMVLKRIENNEDSSDVNLQYRYPRCAKVDVYVPNIDFDARSIAKLLKDYVEKSYNEECKTQISKLIRNFQALANGNYPFAQNITKTFKKYYRYTLSKRTCKDACEANNAKISGTIKKKKKEVVKKVFQKNEIFGDKAITNSKITVSEAPLRRSPRLLSKVFQKNEIFGDKAITNSKITVSEAPLRRSPRLLSKVFQKNEIFGDKAITNSKITESEAPLRRSPRLLSKKPTPTLGQRFPANNKLILDSTPASSKKINIALQMNSSQGVSEYIASVKENPSVPYDANKTPNKGVLKRPWVHSPINPFSKPPKRVKVLREKYFTLN